MKVTIPPTCDRFKKTVADPLDDPAVKIGDNAIALLGQYRVKLGIMNRRMAAARDCDADLRKRFAAGR